MEKSSPQQAIIYLHTPLMYPDAKEEKGAPALRLKGKILSRDASGITLEVQASAGVKGWIDGSPYGKRIFIPLHKIDYLSFE